MRTVPDMAATIPAQFLSEDRATQMDVGVTDALTLLGEVFPPRPEDSDGALALAAVEMLTNQVLRSRLGELSHDMLQRQWWLEGFASGFCVAAADALNSCAGDLDMTSVDRLNDMEHTVLPRLAEQQVEPSRLVFELCRTIVEDDQVGYMWALENLWVSDHVNPRELLIRVQAVLVAALNTCCAAWKLLLLTEPE